jgi:tetratricopeptide (TPR) repeat protein
MRAFGQKSGEASCIRCLGGMRVPQVVLLAVAAFAGMSAGCTTTSGTGEGSASSTGASYSPGGVDSRGLQIELAQAVEDSRSVYRNSSYRILDLPDVGAFYLPAELLVNMRENWVRARQRLKSHPNDARALRLLAVYELSMGNPHAAQTYLGIARAQRGGFDPASALVLGLAHQASGSPQKARVEFARAESQPEGFVLSQLNQGLAALHVGNAGLASQHFQAVLERRPESVLAHLHLGQAQYLLRQYDRALRHFEQATRLDPENNLAHFNKGVVLHRGFQRFDDARESLETVIDSATASRDLKARAEGALRNVERAEHGRENLATIGVY